MYRNRTNVPESITVKVGQTMRHGQSENRPKRRDRPHQAGQPSQPPVESRVLNNFPEIGDSDKFFTNSHRKPTAEFFRAGIDYKYLSIFISFINIYRYLLIFIDIY
jgi:hypothetical protein